LGYTGLVITKGIDHMKVGRKSSFDASKTDDIMASVKKANGSLGTAADLNQIPRVTFYGWVKKGDDDRINNEDSEFAQFSSILRKTQAEVVVSLCKQALANPRKGNFIIWWLGKVCREDFAPDAQEYKELVAIYIKLREDFQRLKDKPLQGAEHVRELDSGGNCQ
jgi:hypothetical protein